LFESLVNANIQFTSEEWNVLIENELDRAGSGAQLLRSLARLPDVIAKGKLAKMTGIGIGPMQHTTLREYRTVTAILNFFREHHESVQISTKAVSMKQHANAQRVYGLALVIGLIFNCVLQGLEVDDADVYVDAAEFCQEVLQLAEEANAYRPLGSSYIILTLIAAWSASNDVATKFAIEQVYSDYRHDFPNSMEETGWNGLHWIRRRLRLL
jgi:hypothetical protein